MQRTTRIWTKPQTQAAMRALVAAGFKQKKLSAGYSITTASGVEVFKAMQGMRGYLVRYVSDLFEVADDTHKSTRATPA